jgi:hypothetical protein
MQEVKEKYQKPTLVSIQLIPGENVLAICHDGTGTGFYDQSFCHNELAACEDVVT